jgi:hypothetical protein
LETAFSTPSEGKTLRRPKGTHPFLREDVLYIRAMTAGFHLRKEILAVILKGLGAKTN